MPDLNDLHDWASRANAAEAATARLAFDRAIALLSSGRFLYDVKKAAPGQLWDGADVLHLPQQPLDVPLGRTSYHQFPQTLSPVAMHVDTQETSLLQTRLTEFLVENNARPFCRPVMVTSDLRLLPFLGLLGLAICPAPKALNQTFQTYLVRKFAVTALVALSTGEMLWTPAKNDA